MLQLITFESHQLLGSPFMCSPHTLCRDQVAVKGAVRTWVLFFCAALQKCIELLLFFFFFYKFLFKLFLIL